MTDSLVIPSRFCGPPGSGNGGYACGRIAAYGTGGQASEQFQPWDRVADIVTILLHPRHAWPNAEPSGPRRQAPLRGA